MKKKTREGASSRRSPDPQSGGSKRLPVPRPARDFFVKVYFFKVEQVAITN